MLSEGGCPKGMLPIRDALEALDGKWKLLILFALSGGPKRFKELTREVSGITDKILSKELKSLEANKLVHRNVHNAFPPMVEYHITPHGRSLDNVVRELYQWGIAHRKNVIGGGGPNNSVILPDIL
jgi:DNA-binding HxlR family transcriptional regulator